MSLKKRFKNAVAKLKGMDMKELKNVQGKMIADAKRGLLSHHKMGKKTLHED